MSRATRQRIIDIYAQRQGGGSQKPRLCKANGKVSYPNAAAAEKAGLMMEKAGATASRAYQCPHSRTVHFHLTTVEE